MLTAEGEPVIASGRGRATWRKPIYRADPRKRRRRVGRWARAGDDVAPSLRGVRLKDEFFKFFASSSLPCA